MTGFAVGAIPGSDGVIHGCFEKSSGALRVVEAKSGSKSKSKCKKGERAISWNEQGRAGPVGTQGAQGAQGSDAQFNGAGAGGDLTGAYPNPSVGPNAITGAKVQDDSLGGSDVDESSLGQVPDSAKLGGLLPATFPRRLSTAGSFGVGGSVTISPPAASPGLAVRIECVSSPSTGTKAVLINKTASSMDVFITDSSPSTTTTYVEGVAANGEAPSGIDTSTDTVRRVTFQTTGPGVVGSVVTVSLTRRSSGSPACRGTAQIVQ